LLHQGDTKATISIPDELGKLAKLKERGVITGEEFSQIKRNLMEGMKVYVPFVDTIAQKENSGGVRHRTTQSTTLVE
jgi:hypothetical protein